MVHRRKHEKCSPTQTRHCSYITIASRDSRWQATPIRGTNAAHIIHMPLPCQTHKAMLMFAYISSFILDSDMRHCYKFNWSTLSPTPKLRPARKCKRRTNSNVRKNAMQVLFLCYRMCLVFFLFSQQLPGEVYSPAHVVVYLISRTLLIYNSCRQSCVVRRTQMC